MNKEINSNNYQDHPHHEGQQQNIADHGQARGKNNPPTLDNQQESRKTREAESDRAQGKERDRATRKSNK